MSWSGSVSAEPGTTVVDSLVWDIQQLERELVQCEIEFTATTDMLKHELRWTKFDLSASMDREMRWYQKPIIWFGFGAGVMALIVASIFRVEIAR